MARFLYPYRRLSAGIAFAALLLAGCHRETRTASPSAAGSPEPLRFQVDWYPQAEHGGFFQALARGDYAAHGLNVSILPGRPGFTAQQSVLSGTSDVSMARSDDIITMVSRGLPLVIVGVYMEHDPQAILVHADGPIHTFSDLNGRTVMAAAGANWVDYIRLKYHISFATVPVTFGIAQFMADPKFAQQCFLTNEPYFVEQRGGHPKVLPLSDAGFDPYRVIFTTRAYARDHAPALRAFLAASQQGWQEFLTGDPKPAMDLILKANAQMSVPFMQFSISAMKQYHVVDGWTDRGEHAGLMTRQRLADQCHVLAQLHLIPTELSPDDFASF
ncbi:MAG TPA: ABC transporter substrate-binding protein [Opitutaceae bacterium]|jgi:NitT/TauT family transport system substrate-binding protein